RYIALTSSPIVSSARELVCPTIHLHERQGSGHRLDRASRGSIGRSGVGFIPPSRECIDVGTTPGPLSYGESPLSAPSASNNERWISELPDDMLLKEPCSGPINHRATWSWRRPALGPGRRTLV